MGSGGGRRRTCGQEQFCPRPSCESRSDSEETEGRSGRRQEAGHTSGRELSLRSRLAIADS